MPDHPLLAAALDALAVPLPEAELARALHIPPGSAEAAAVIAVLVDTGRILSLGDGRLASASALLDGLALWHRVDSVEVTMRRVSFGLDIVPALTATTSPADVLVGDAVVPLIEWYGPDAPDIERGPTVALPDGWGDDLAPGDLVAITSDGHRLRLLRDDDPDLPQEPHAGGPHADVLAGALARMADSHGSRLSILCDRARDESTQWIVDLELHGRILLADHGAALRALHRLPLREAVVRAGCASRGCMVAGPGVDAQSLETYVVGWTVAADLPVEESVVFEACGVVTGALTGGRVGGGRTEVDQRATDTALRVLLRDPLVTQVIVEHMRRVHLAVASEAEARLRSVHRAHRSEPGPAWVRASALLRQGRSKEARECLDRVVDRFDGTGFDDWPLLVRTAAQLRAISGDLAPAIRLLDRAEWDDDAAELARWRPRPPEVGRNERCPCGSGAKAKACCLLTPPPLPIGERVPLVWHKLCAWALAHECGASAAAIVASGMVGHAPTALRRALTAFTVHLLEGGGVGAVLDEVGPLLPDDEYDVAMRWRFGRHGLWVVERGDASTPVWRDVVTDARARLVGTLDPSKHLPTPPPGTHLLAPVLPSPIGHVLAGDAVEVPADTQERATETVAMGSDLPLMALLWDLHGVGPDLHSHPDAA